MLSTDRVGVYGFDPKTFVVSARLTMWFFRREGNVF
jgi:hypothetical protein